MMRVQLIVEMDVPDETAKQQMIARFEEVKQQLANDPDAQVAHATARMVFRP